MASGQRIILLFFAFSIISFNSIPSPVSSDHSKPPVSFSNSTSTVLIRIKGESIVPGVYAVPGGSTVASLMHSMGISSGIDALNPTVLHMRLKSGYVLDLGREGHAPEVSRMKTREKLVLGIPLDPDRMDLEDWSAVPGIGPRMAKRIIDDR